MNARAPSKGPNPAGPAGRIAAAKAVAQTSGGTGAGSSGGMVADPAAELMQRLGALSAKDLSMAGAALDETQYEFNDDSDVEQSRDDIDDFEMRLVNGLGAKRSAPSKVPPPKTKASHPEGASGKKVGSDYVKSAAAGKAAQQQQQQQQQQQRPKPAAAQPKKAAEDDDDDRDDVKQAMKDLDRFGYDHGADSDDD
jgi:hypothetical protein